MNLKKIQLPSHFPDVINWPRSAQFYLSLFGCLIVWLILYGCINTSINKHLKLNATMITHLTHQLNEQRHYLAEEEMTYQNQTRTINQSLLNTLQPQRLSHFLTKLIALANTQQLELDTIKPLQLEITQGLYLQPIQISTYGHYHTFLNFLTQLQTTAALHTLGDFDIQPLPVVTDTTTHEHILKLTMIVNLFTQLVNPLR